MSNINMNEKEILLRIKRCIQKAGINPKPLQYLMGHSDIAITLNVYTHIKYEDAKEELCKLQLEG